MQFFSFFLLPSQKSYISSCGWGRVTLSFKGTWGSSYQESHQALLCRCCAISAFMSIGCAFLSPQQHLCTEQVVHALESGTAELSTPFYHLLACIAPSACPCSVFPHFLLDKSQRGWQRINKQRYPVQCLLLTFLILESCALVFGTVQVCGTALFTYTSQLYGL